MQAIRTILKRALVVGHDAVALITIAALASLAYVTPAYAYVDPSVMTYTIQALAGVAVALSAIAGVAFRRSRRAIMKALGIDENASKTVEPDVHRVEGDLVLSQGDANATSKRSASDKQAKRQREAAGTSPSVVQRLVLSLVVSTFLVLTFYVMGAYETLAGNETSLVFGFNEAWRPIAIASLITIAVLTIILTLLRGRVFNAVLIFLFAIGLCCYLQAMFFNQGIPTTDGRPVDWREFRLPAIGTMILWVATVVVLVWLGTKRGKLLRGIVSGAAVALIIVQGVAIASIFSDNAAKNAALEEGSAPASSYMLTENGMRTLSPGNNVIVFALDTFDTTDMMTALRDEPELESRLSGFTWFRNSVGSMSPTRYGAPYLWTGVYPEADEPLEDFIGDRFRRSTFLSELEQANYSIGLYTDTIADMALTDSERKELIYDKTINITPPEDDYISSLNTTGTLKATLMCSLYRDTPWFLKPFFYYTTDELNQAMVDEEPTGATSVPYTMDDAVWYEKLQKNGLSLEEGSDNAGAYRFIHLEGTHQPYVIDKNGQKATHQTTLNEQALGSLEMVLYYIEEMKRLGIYDDATIIITADHGIWWESYPGPLPWLSSPLMLVKPVGQTADRELQVSDAEITTYDMFPTILKAIGADASAYDTVSLFDQNETNRDRRYVLTHCVSGVDQILVEYRITGDVLDWNSWEETGTTWDPSNTPQP